jgi:hypothetical protein
MTKKTARKLLQRLDACVVVLEKAITRRHNKRQLRRR